MKGGDGSHEIISALRRGGAQKLEGAYSESSEEGEKPTRAG